MVHVVVECTLTSVISSLYFAIRDLTPRGFLSVADSSISELEETVFVDKPKSDNP